MSSFHRAFSRALFGSVAPLGALSTRSWGKPTASPAQCKEKHDANVDAAAKLYDKQSANWVRKKPNCLSDFTGRPVVFAMLQKEIVPTTEVLDVGAGEGYCARAVRGMGAAKVVGVEISPEMVQRAKDVEAEDNMGGLKYVVGDATQIQKALISNSAEIGLTYGHQFDLAMAVFVFNYVTIAQMQATLREVYAVLKPGKCFVFSVPHPAMVLVRESGADSRFHFEVGAGYFSSRDIALKGQIMTRDGKALNVTNTHKTIEDYVSSLLDVGFEIVEVREAAVTEEHLKLDPKFFGPMKDKPLHMVFKVRKPSK